MTETKINVIIKQNNVCVYDAMSLSCFNLKLNFVCCQIE